MKAQRGPEVSREHHVHGLYGPTHDIELTGIYVAPDGDFPGDAKINDVVPNACYGIGATYLGIDPGDAGQHRAASGGCSGAVSAILVRWRSIQCAVSWASSRGASSTGSIKGRQPGTFPH